MAEQKRYMGARDSHGTPLSGIRGKVPIRHMAPLDGQHVGTTRLRHYGKKLFWAGDAGAIRSLYTPSNPVIESLVSIIHGCSGTWRRFNDPELRARIDLHLAQLHGRAPLPTYPEDT